MNKKVRIILLASALSLSGCGYFNIVAADRIQPSQGLGFSGDQDMRQAECESINFYRSLYMSIGVSTGTIGTGGAVGGAQIEAENLRNISTISGGVIAGLGIISFFISEKYKSDFFNMNCHEFVR